MQSEVERLGEALFALSDKLRASGFLNDDANRAAYEKVVAAFQAVPSDDRLASMRDVEREGEGAAALIRSMQETIERLEGELNTWRRAVTGAAPLRTVASRNTDIGEAPRATVRDRNAPDRKP